MENGRYFNAPGYRAENLKDVAFLGSKCGEFPYVRGTKKDNNWQIHQTIGAECSKRRMPKPPAR